MKVKKNVSTNNRRQYLGYVKILRDARCVIKTVHSIMYTVMEGSADRKVKSRSELCSISAIAQIAPALLVQRLDNRRFGHDTVGLLNALRSIATLSVKKKHRTTALAAYRSLLAYKKYIILPNNTMYKAPNFSIRTNVSMQRGRYSFYR